MHNTRSDDGAAAWACLVFVVGVIVVTLAIQSGILWVAVPLTFVVYAGTRYFTNDRGIAAKAGFLVMAALMIFGAWTELFAV